MTGAGHVLEVRGVRAAACYSVALAKNSREHNDANVLTLGAGQTNLETAKQIVETFLAGDQVIPVVEEFLTHAGC